MWLIHRLGGVEKPTVPAFVEACLKQAYGGTSPWIGDITTTSSVGAETHLRCLCSRCKEAA